ncbi:hypothetical protein BH20ACT11_BH20ACT11_01420 [soil metagenome]
MKVREAAHQLTTRTRVVVAGAATGMVLVALTSSPVLAAGGASSGAAPESTSAQSSSGQSSSAQAPMHEQMHGMMNSVHGKGATQKMHEAMGPQAEKMMDQCGSMMSMMGNMENMQNTENMQGMMNGGMQGNGM